MASINPPAEILGRRNAILWGRGRRQYHVRDFPGPLSIKSVVRGSAAWRTSSARFEIDSGSYLLLNDGQAYSITVDSAYPVETFCLFFERGLVEDACRTLAQPPAALLDDPACEPPAAVGFFERLHRRDDTISPLLDALYAAAHRGASSEWLDDQFYAIAEQLGSVRAGIGREVARVPAARASTRLELYRRLQRGKALLDDPDASRVALPAVARAACLSPFHFHRSFTAAFGETPARYAVRRRLERAARLLRETDAPVTGVSLDSGFESLGSFSALFHRRYGATPSDYRARANSARTKKTAR